MGYALEFPNGRIILLAGLSEGQHWTVLQLPVSARKRSRAAKAVFSRYLIGPLAIELARVSKRFPYAGNKRYLGLMNDSVEGQRD
jgi:hypothetical protein